MEYLNKDIVQKYQFDLINTIPMGLTFDDVLMVPQYSNVNSRSECSLKSKFSQNIPLNIPIVSSPMDTVTEWQLAKEMARNGGLGIIHRFMKIEQQCQQVLKVKRAQAHILYEPILVSQDTTYGELKLLGEKYPFQTFLVSDQYSNEKQSPNHTPIRRKSFEQYDQYTNQGELMGIITKRDILNFTSLDQTVKEQMTPREKLCVLNIESSQLNNQQAPTQDEILKMMVEKRVEKIPVVNSKNQILALVTKKDILRNKNLNMANMDNEGKLLVGAAIGANKDYLERASDLIKSYVDVLVVDIANGHNQLCIDAVKKLKEQFPNIDIVAGSIATGEGAEELIKSGANGIRCGIGNGSICITRIVAGSGVPQFSALLDVAPVCKKYGIPLISDGGNKNSGNMCKALAIGADCLMLGRLVAGCEESPSQVIYKEGKIQKVFRGMAGLGANISKAQNMGEKEPSYQKFNPEGIEGYIPYAGPLEGVLTQFVQGIQSGMSYSGARTIQELQQRARFIRMTASSLKESGVHGVSQF